MKFNSNQTVAYPVSNPIYAVGGAAGLDGRPVPVGAIVEVARMTKRRITKRQLRSAAQDCGRASSPSQSFSTPKFLRTARPDTWLGVLPDIVPDILADSFDVDASLTQLCKNNADQAKNRAPAANNRAVTQPGGKAESAR